MTTQELSTLFDKLYSDWNGKPLMVLPSSIKNKHGQCFDLPVEFAHRLGVPNYPNNPSPFPYEHAYQIYTEFGSFQAKYFDRIPNTPDYVVQEADIVVWAPQLNGGDGHVALGTKDADMEYFISLDENWDPSDWYPKRIWHDYNTGPVLGALRFKVTSSETPPPMPTELEKKAKGVLEQFLVHIRDNPQGHGRITDAAIETWLADSNDPDKMIGLLKAIYSDSLGGSAKYDALVAAIKKLPI